MGRGDIKTAKGKRVRGSYGNTRRKKTSKNVVVAPAKKAAEKTEAPAKKVAAKKPTGVKKTTAKAEVEKED